MLRIKQHNLSNKQQITFPSQSQPKVKEFDRKIDIWTIMISSKLKYFICIQQISCLIEGRETET